MPLPTQTEAHYELADLPFGNEVDALQAIALATALVQDRYGIPSDVQLQIADGATIAVSTLDDADRYLLGDLLVAGVKLREASPSAAVATFAATARGPKSMVATLRVTVAESNLRVTVTVEPEAPGSFDSVLSHIETVLRAATVGPDTQFGDIDILTDADRQVLLTQWNASHISYPATTLHQLFSDQAGRTPDAIAIIDGSTTITYAELDAMSNRVAHQLRPYVTQPGQVIASGGSRSAGTLTVKIGIMKAGGAYLYLDPSTPASRVRLICEIAEPVAVIYARDEPRPDTTAPRLILEELLDNPDVPDHPVIEIADESTAAYILFTSGSTGEPKGVVRPHRMHTTRIFLEQKLYHLDSSDRHLMKSVPFFREFYWALATGGTLIVARPGGEQDDAYLIDLIRSRGITVCGFVPSMLRVLLANPQFRRPGLPIKHLFTAGEAFDAELEQRIRGLGPALHITYTLAEADYVCHRSGKDPGEGQRNSVGRPIDMRIYLCDPQGRMRPPGFPGEFYTGGPGIADGYINRPQLTSERFLHNPFDPDLAPRLFRTGDLGRFRPDGQVEFIGRADLQIKVRGQRVEPTEVEHVMRGDGQVENVVVAGLPDTDQGFLLVAYVVPKNGHLDMSELRRFLGEQLPAYMVPSYVVPVATLPLLISGKVDRASLKTVLTARAADLGPAAHPDDELERTIAEVWSTVLGVTDVGVEDPFIDLGGDSLKVMLLRIALEERLGEPVGLTELLEAPTVRDFADYLRTSR